MTQTPTEGAGIPAPAAVTPDNLDLIAGGWVRGAEPAGIDPARFEGVELDAAAVEAARAAGYTRLQANVLDLLDPPATPMSPA